MKKILLVITIIIITICPIFAEKQYIINTVYGDKTVVIPDGYTEKDVLLIIAKSYYEQDEEYKLTKQSLQKLTDSVELYIEENNRLNDNYEELLLSYERLVSKYNSLLYNNRLSGVFSGNVQFSTDFKFNSAGIDIGVYMFNKILLTAGTTYKFNTELNEAFNFNVRLGFTF